MHIVGVIEVRHVGKHAIDPIDIGGVGIGSDNNLKDLVTPFNAAGLGVAQKEALFAAEAVNHWRWFTLERHAIRFEGDAGAPQITYILT